MINIRIFILSRQLSNNYERILKLIYLLHLMRRDNLHEIVYVYVEIRSGINSYEQMCVSQPMLSKHQ